MSAPQHPRARLAHAVTAARVFGVKVRRHIPFRNAQPRLLRELTVSQRGGELTIVLTPYPSVLPLALWSLSDETRQWTRHTAFTAAGAHYTATLDLGTLPRPPQAQPGGARTVLYVEVDQTLVSTETAMAEGLGEYEGVEISTGPNGRPVAHYRIMLARATRTDLGKLTETTVGGVRVRPYVTERGALAVVSDRELKPYGAISVRWFGIHGGRLRLRGRLDTREQEVQQVELVLKGRTTDYRVSAPAQFEPDPQRTRLRYGQRWYDVRIDFDCARLLDDPEFSDDTYDVWLSVTALESAEPYSVRVGRTRFAVRRLTRAGWAQNSGRAVAIAPYYTFKAKRTSLQMNVFDADTYEYLRRATRTRHLDRLRHRGRKVWLVGERPYKAQDSGLHFFRHLRENHPEVDAYYVIEKDSPERANVEPLGNVVDFKSKEHIEATLLADTVAGTHHAEFLFPTSSKQFVRKVRATRVFLQHGVMGAKWTSDLYHKSGFDTDAFVVSSERERELIVRDFGFEPSEVANTGLARFDALFAGDVPVNPRQVLVMPTWRWFLQDADAYPESDYHRTWTAFLHDPRLRALEDRYGLEVVLALHPNMYQFRHLFADTPVRMVSQGEVDIQRLLKESALLITDYSSVGWDFSFLDKPVIFYQFDRSEMAAPHIEPDEELPGPIPLTANALFLEFERLAATGFAMTAEYRARADRFIDHRDRNNSERIFQHARALKPGRNLYKRVASHELTDLAWQQFRRSRYYIPLVRRFYWLARRIVPVDPRLVVFEAGMGRQYADSPRYIYEELLRRGYDLKKVWSYTGRLPNADPDTKVVSRHSPAFYWYLARAKYWVNNQNFPDYVTRRPDGFYLQTWHGTPLKRLLHDLDAVHGRDDGYVGRVTTMVRQWSALLSPSPFATETLRGALRYDGEILELGYPRNDVFRADDRDLIAQRIRHRFNIRDDQRVILYAPTFRDDQTSRPGAFTFQIPLDLQRFCDTLGEGTVLLLRMHVHVQSRITIPENLRHLVFDVSSHPEIQDLYLASDVLITDYSSVFFDYAALRRPILFYAYDLEHYQQVLRGFYLDYERELPGAIVTDEDELLHALQNLEEVDAPFQADRDKFLDRFAPWDDGAAAARVVDRIFGPDR